MTATGYKEIEETIKWFLFHKNLNQTTKDDDKTTKITSLYNCTVHTAAQSQKESYLRGKGVEKLQIVGYNGTCKAIVFLNKDFKLQKCLDPEKRK